MITLNKINVKFNDTTALSNISLKIAKGEFVYIVGASGAGKTTLFRTLYLDLIPNKGSVRFGKLNLKKIKKKHIPHLRRKIGIIFQDYKLLEDRSILDNVIFAMRVTGNSAKKSKIKSIKALTSVGLLQKKDNLPTELSGGELQRACIARALVNNPKVILADEPTGNLDPETGRDIIGLLKNINKAGAAVIIATHNYQIIKDFPGRIIYLDKGEISENPPDIVPKG